MRKDIFKCKNKNLSLKLVEKDKRYYNLSFTLEG
jgi:hypothetical protein